MSGRMRAFPWLLGLAVLVVLGAIALAVVARDGVLAIPHVLALVCLGYLADADEGVPAPLTSDQAPGR